MRFCCFLWFGDDDTGRDREEELLEEAAAVTAADMEGGGGGDDRLPLEDAAAAERREEDQAAALAALEDFDLELNFFLGLPGMSDDGGAAGAGAGAGEAVELTAGGTQGCGSKRDLDSAEDRESDGFNPLDLSIGQNTTCHRSSRSSEQFLFLPGAIYENARFAFEWGESSGSFAPEDSKFDWELQNKRAKFGDGLQKCVRGSAGSSSMDANSCNDRDNCSLGSIKEISRLISSSSNSHGGEACLSGGEDEGLVDSANLVQMDLSDDLLHMVFSFLDHIHLCQAAMVCKQWRTASAHEDFWRSLHFECSSISVPQFEDICRRYPRATAVSFTGTPLIQLLVMRAISLLRNLEVLTLGKGQLLETFFNALPDCRMLKRLVINDAALGSSGQEISINHETLQHLQIIKCRVVRISIRCPQLEELSLKRTTMAHAVLTCPLLRELDIASCHKLPDTAIRSAVTSCPMLEYLDMSNCSCVTDETLQNISNVCHNIHILDASYCPNISLENVELRMLTALKLDSCEGITSASMAAIAKSPMLEVLKLDNCSLLTSVSLDLHQLRDISLVHCRKFVDLNLRCLKLSSISVSNSAALHRINITSNALKKLVLQKQESLTSLSLQCRNLQEVDLSDCESLSNSICEVFSDGGGCPLLKTLVLDNCEGLKAVQLCSSSLVSLSLAGCRKISTLELSCPNLEQVRLDGCDHLEEASFCPAGLQALNLGICPKLNTLFIEAPSMVLLELKGCGVLSEASINCPQLTSLDASFCSQLKDDCLSATAASCPLIESLILMSCPSIGPDGLFSLKWLKNLIYLDLSYTFLMDLQPIFESCSQLKVLKLQACKYLNDASLEPMYEHGALPALSELDLSYGTLCQAAIEELLACCTHLTHVSLNGCINMHDLNWDSNKTSLQLAEKTPVQQLSSPRLLQNLNCVGCPSIREVHIPLAARCEYLSSLNLSLSTNLREVNLACSSLCFLNLSNCNSLEILKLDCPRLTSLFLQSCNVDEEAVVSAISGCSILETLDVRFCPKICSASMSIIRVTCPSLKRVFRQEV